MKPPQIIVVDLDGTLCDTNHRVDYAQAGEWDAYHSRIAADRAHLDVSRLISHMVSDNAPDWEVWLISGREERFLWETQRWLAARDIVADRILLRPAHDRSPDHELKLRLLVEALGSMEAVIDHVAFVLEDKDRVVEAYRNAGLPCWQVRIDTY